MQHSALVQHCANMLFTPLNRPPVGKDTIQYMLVSAVNLLLFFLSLSLHLLCSIVSGWLQLRQAPGWAVQQSSIWVHILWHPSQMPRVWNLLLALWRVCLPSPHPTQRSTGSTAKLSEEKDDKWGEGENKAQVTAQSWEHDQTYLHNVRQICCQIIVLFRQSSFLNLDLTLISVSQR